MSEVYEDATIGGLRLFLVFIEIAKGKKNVIRYNFISYSNNINRRITIIGSYRIFEGKKDLGV